MTTYTLGVNTSFAVKRWPEPEAWAAIVRDRLGLRLVQHSLDLVELAGSSAASRRAEAKRVREACGRFGLNLHSTFTGLAAYSFNLLLDPDASRREHAERWYRMAIQFTAAVGGRATGGHVGAFSVSDWRDAKTRRARERQLVASLRRLASAARTAGLQEFYVENLASAREPSTMEGVSRLLKQGDPSHVPIVLCLDVGHQCVPGTEGADRDPYAWLERFGAMAPVVQLQQSDADADHHWPFTPAYNVRGRIDGEHVLQALDRSGASEVQLILEIIPPFEQEDELVLSEMAISAAYWQEAIARHLDIPRE
jgi:D-erythrulose 1-phosphate 3-epimerase